MRDTPFEPALDLFLLGRILLGIWFTALGSSAGSFLNVVIYRWPNGRSVVRPGSRCPHCGHAVRWYDNIPILNWFWLRGRCRDCQVPIPFRYPAVEMVVAAIFLALYLLYVVYLGVNLPRGWERRFSPELMHLLIPLLVYQATYFTVLVASILIRYDGHPVPWELRLSGWVFGWALVIIWPHVHPVPIVNSWRLPPHVMGALSGALGLLAGLLAGAIANAPAAGRPREERHLTLVDFELALCGLFLGWQAACVIGTVVLFLNILHRIAARYSSQLRAMPVAIWVFVVSGAYVALWRLLAKTWPILRGII